MANGNRPGRDIFSEEIIQEQIRRQPELGVKDINEIQSFQELVAPAWGFTEEESRRSPDLGLHQEIYPEYFEEQPNLIIPTAQQLPPRWEVRGYSLGDRPWNPYHEIPHKAIKDVPVYLPADTEIKGEGQKYEEEYLKENPFPRTEFQNSWLGSFLEQLGFGSG